MRQALDIVRMEDALLEETIRLATLGLLQTQSADASWRDSFDTGLMPDAETVIFLHLMGVKDEEWIDPLLRHISALQRSDGGWGLYDGDDGDVSVSVACYYALTLYDAWSTPDMREGAPHSDRRRRAREFIRSRGGLKQCRNLTKILLAIGAEIPWTWLPSPRLYSHLFSRMSPVSIWDITMFTRLHVAPMLLLSHLRYVSDTVTEPVLRDLIVDDGERRRGERRRRRQWVQVGRHGRGGRGGRAFSGPNQGRRFQMPPRIERCLNFILREREVDGTVAGYHSSTFLMLLALRVLGTLRKAPAVPYDAVLAAIRRNLLVDPTSGYVHQQTCNAHVWNTALATKTLLYAGVPRDSKSVEEAVRYLISRQQSCGAWGYSDNNTIHPDTDDTVACLDVLARTGGTYTLAFQKGAKWLLSMQKRDGGWSAFERDCDKRWLEKIPANDMLRAMHDPSTPDITARVVEFLLAHHVLQPNDARIERALRWLRQHQEKDGSWFGRWGNTYLYGSWCVVKALAAAHLLESDMAQKAKRWLLSVQLPDGGFGESCESDTVGRLVPTPTSVPTQTAWGLDALLYFMERDEIGETRPLREREETPSLQPSLEIAVTRAAHWLMATRARDGWRETAPNGTAFPGSVYIRYHIYPKVWPLIALSHYNRMVRRNLSFGLTLKGGEANVGSSFAGHVSRANREPALLAADVSNSPLL